MVFFNWLSVALCHRSDADGVINVHRKKEQWPSELFALESSYMCVSITNYINKLRAVFDFGVVYWGVACVFF